MKFQEKNGHVSQKGKSTPKNRDVPLDTFLIKNDKLKKI